LVPIPFEISEYGRRLRAVRSSMETRGIDLLIVTDIANQHYLTAYDGWSFYTPQIVAVPIEDEEPVWIGRAMDAAGGRLTAWMRPDNVIGFPEDYVQRTDRHPMDWIAQYLCQRGWSRRRIGIEMEAYYYSAKAHERLVAGLPDARISDASLVVNWVRSVKSPGEIVYLRKAARLAECAVRAAYDIIEPGIRECDAVAAIQAAQVAGLPDVAGDITALPATILGGENASAPHITWSDRRFGVGETIALELAGACRRYTAGLARTLQLGVMPPKVAETAKAVMEGMDAVLNEVRPGATGELVEAAWRKVIARYGLKKESRIGYSIGLAYPPDWGEHTISLRQGDTHILETGNVLHCILGMWMEGWGLEISETILVTEAGCETLTQFPRAVFVKG
jgi:ectoine hydrolase